MTHFIDTPFNKYLNIVNVCLKTLHMCCCDQQCLKHDYLLHKSDTKANHV